MEVARKRKGSINPEQKRILKLMVASNEGLRSTKFSSNFTIKDAQKAWKEIAAHLNAVPGGATKDWKSWRKCWQDWKSIVKRKALKVKRNSVETKEEPPMTFFDNTEESMMEVISPVAIDDGTVIAESTASLNFNDDDRMEEFEFLEDDFEESKVQNIFPTDTLSAHRRLHVPESITINSKTHFFKLRKEYYDEKLKLMRRNVVAKEKIAESLSEIAQNLANKIKRRRSINEPEVHT